MFFLFKQKTAYELRISDWISDVCSSDLMALFLNSASIWDIPLQHAGYYVSLYWLGAMIGRFVGSALLTRIKAHRLLAVNTAIAAALCLFVVLTRGVPAGYAALSIGLGSEERRVGKGWGRTCGSGGRP